MTKTLNMKQNLTKFGPGDEQLRSLPYKVTTTENDDKEKDHNFRSPTKTKSFLYGSF